MNGGDNWRPSDLEEWLIDHGWVFVCLAGIIGAVFGGYLGFNFAGIGGAIVFGLIGGIVGAVLGVVFVLSLPQLIGSIILFAIAYAIYHAISSLWGVGKPQ